MRIFNFGVGGASLVSGVSIFAILYAAHATGMYAVSTATVGAIAVISGAILLYRAVK